MVWPSRLIELAVLALALGFAAYAVAVARRGRREALAAAAAADSRRREATILAETAGALLSAPSPTGPVAPRLERALSDVGARLQLCHAPSPAAGEVALPLRMADGTGWIYVDREGPLGRADAERLVERMSELVVAAQERTRVTETAAETEAQRQAELAKTSVMHAISHDLRVPVEHLHELHAALSRARAEDEQRELARMLERETAQLERMADDLLDLSRIEAGATNPQPEWCDVAEVVNAAAGRVRVERPAFELRSTLPPDLPLVKADRAQLERVFTNLLENAAKFSDADEPVEVRGICANGRVTIRVLDRGRGIAPAQQSQVFRAFVRGSGPESGSGLGLAICRGFVEANGGRITLQSGSRDGSAFAVSFPASPQPSAVR